MNNPIIVAFPLRGEWQSPNTPGNKIPSHGTNRFGTRYAYDFIQVDWNRRGWPAYRSSLPQYLIDGLPISDYYCWGQKFMRHVMVLLLRPRAIMKNVSEPICWEI